MYIYIYTDKLLDILTFKKIFLIVYNVKLGNHSTNDNLIDMSFNAFACIYFNQISLEVSCEKTTRLDNRCRQNV